MSGVCIMGAEEPHEWVEGIEERKQELFNEVQENQAKAHKRQKANFEKRKQSGLKTFDLKIGDAVLKRRMRKRPIGGKTDTKMRGAILYTLHLSR